MARERQMPMRRRRTSEREQLDLFRALPGDLAPRDAQDLMAYPFFSLAKSKRTVPIDFRAGKITIRVEAVPEHGMATIWDADVLIWAASQIVEARDAGLKTSRLMAATPYEILTFVGRGTSARDYDRLKAARAEHLPRFVAGEKFHELHRRLAMFALRDDDSGIFDRIMRRRIRGRHDLHFFAGLDCIGFINNSGIDFAALDIAEHLPHVNAKHQTIFQRVKNLQ